MTPLILVSTLLSGPVLSSPVPAATYTFADPCKPYVTMAPVAGTYGCYSFTASIGAVIGGSSYFSWQFGDGAAATGTQVLHCYTPVTSPAQFTGTLTYNTPALCGPNSTSTTFTVDLSPPHQDSCVIAGPAIIRSALSVTVPGVITYPEMIRQINFGDGGGFGFDLTHTYPVCGSYIVTTKTWDMNAPDTVCYGYTAVVIDCNGIPTGTGHRARAIPALFPNPARDRLNIKSGKTIIDAGVTDLLGSAQPVTLHAGSQVTVVGLESLAAGAYVMKIVYFDNTVDFVRFLKE